MLSMDDSLDVFGVHGVGGIVGALLTGVFNSPSARRPGAVGDWVTVAMVTPAGLFDRQSQFWIQLKGGAQSRSSGRDVVSVVAYKIVDVVIGCASRKKRREGLDIASHGETAYHG